MTLRKFRYVCALLFLAFGLVAVEGNAEYDAGYKLCAASKKRSDVTSGCSGQALFDRVVDGIDEGILVDLGHHHNNSAQSQSREKDSVPVYVIHSARWHFSAAFSLLFSPAARDELDSFTPMAQLLVFPKHWFW